MLMSTLYYNARDYRKRGTALFVCCGVSAGSVKSSDVMYKSRRKVYGLKKRGKYVSMRIRV